MLKTPEEMITDFREKMRGGEGTIVIKNLFKPEEIQGKARLIAEVTIPEGGSIGFHHHEQEEEIFYFISGMGEVDDGGTIKSVGPGSAMMTGNGAGHGVKNTGDQPLVLMAVILVY